MEIYGFNERAQTHAERAGWVREGVRRKAYDRQGDWVDGVLYGIVREDSGPGRRRPARAQRRGLHGRRRGWRRNRPVARAASGDPSLDHDRVRHVCDRLLPGVARSVLEDDDQRAPGGVGRTLAGGKAHVSVRPALEHELAEPGPRSPAAMFPARDKLEDERRLQRRTSPSARRARCAASAPTAVRGRRWGRQAPPELAESAADERSRSLDSLPSCAASTAA